MTFKPMLAETLEFDTANALESLKALRYPVLVSPKLDGIRAIVRNGVVVSRKLLPIPNAHVQRLFGRPEFEGLDGELIVGDETAADCYNVTSSGVMSQDGEPDVTFCVFDMTGLDLPYQGRLRAAAGYQGRGRVAPVLHQWANGPQELLELEDKLVAAGYEGVMVRDPAGPYKHGRSTLREGYLLKIKRFADGEAEIIGATEEMHNGNAAERDALGRTKRSTAKAGKVGKGVLGTLVVRELDTNVVFEIGSGFTGEERKKLWEMYVLGLLDNRIAKFRHQPAGRKHKPRFPTWHGFRNRIDMGEPA